MRRFGAAARQLLGGRGRSGFRLGGHRVFGRGFLRGSGFGDRLFSGSLDNPIMGSATLTPAQAADFMSGKWYVNLHTAANKGGEVRAQALLAP